MCVCVCVRACACARVRACVHACVHVFVCVSVCHHLFVWLGSFLCTLIRYLGFMGILFFMLSWMFQHDYLDTCCFECLIFMYFVFAPVQRN